MTSPGRPQDPARYSSGTFDSASDRQTVSTSWLPEAPSGRALETREGETPSVRGRDLLSFSFQNSWDLQPTAFIFATDRWA